MKPIVQKVLESGIVDRGLVELLEKWGNLPEGSTELLKSEKLKDATKAQLEKFAKELADEIANEHILRETQLDLDQLRWPTKATVNAYIPDKTPASQKKLIYDIPAMVDRMGRLYFRIQDIDEEWFIPGFTISRLAFSKTSGCMSGITERILEKQVLFAGDQPIALQVTVARMEE